MIPYNITDLSIMFFAKGRPWQVGRDNRNFESIRSALLSPDPDIDNLIELADITMQLKNAGLVFEDGIVSFNGTPLHNVWVDKILEFSAAGLPYDPIFNALKDLMINPTPAAIERLPIFVERSGLGFLPDGRIAAYKGVRENFFDVHTGSVKYEIGTTVSIDRASCDDDPYRTCSSGLHIGALDYIQRLGYGWGRDRRLLLCAFWPRDAVAVPVDYEGGKMRVCSLDVIEEVDRAFVDEHFGFNRLIVGQGLPASDEEASRSEGVYLTAEPGDIIHLAEGGVLPPDWYEVTSIDNTPNTRCRVYVKTSGGDSFGVFNHLVTGVKKQKRLEPAWKLAKVGDRIEIEYPSFYDLDNYIIEVIATDESNPHSRLYVDDHSGTNTWIDNEDVIRIVT